jgi:YD repeat-containing protein
MMQSIDLTFNAEDRVVRVHKDGSEVASFTYDGNGARVQKQAPDGTVTTYVGGIYEVQGSVETSYYYAGSQRVAMRRVLRTQCSFGLCPKLPSNCGEFPAVAPTSTPTTWARPA